MSLFEISEIQKMEKADGHQFKEIINGRFAKMAELTHKHGRKNASDVRKLVEKSLDDLGYSDYVEWDGNSFSASAGLGMMLDLEGRITDEEFIVEKCTGALGDKVLSECRKIAQDL
jgi:hypothetical protein